MGGLDGRGIGRGAGWSPGGNGEEAGHGERDESVSGAVEAKEDTEGVESSRVSGKSRQLTSAAASLHTSQKGSGHNS